MALNRLLYLGFSFPPGIQALYPGLIPAGHAFETQMVAALNPFFDIRSVGTLPIPISRIAGRASSGSSKHPAPADVLRLKIPTAGSDANLGDRPDAVPTSGVAHRLLLPDRRPVLFHRLRSIFKLREQFKRWQGEGWLPGAVLVYNLSPIYNHFVGWLRRQSPRPRLVLLLLDSSQLGSSLPLWKRFRYRFKPLRIPDAQMILQFEACIGLSPTTERFFAPRHIPFLWMPGACTPERAVERPAAAPESNEDQPIRFGYFGALAAHAGVLELARTLLATHLRNPLHICGFGKLSAAFAELARADARLRFHGLLPNPDDCLKLAQSCDVLVNPRPAGYGNENTFPSKLFEYALGGRAILSTRLCGAEAVLGPAAFYFDERAFSQSLREAIERLALIPRGELNRRGQVLQQRVTEHYSWSRQAERMQQFICLGS